MLALGLIDFGLLDKLERPPAAAAPRALACDLSEGCLCVRGVDVCVVCGLCWS